MTDPHDAPARSVRGLVLALVALVTALELWLVLDWGGDQVTLWADDLGESLAPLAAALLCLRTARRTQGSDRRSWLLLSCSAASWCAGQVVWSSYELYLGRAVPFPGLPDVGYLASVPFAALAVLTWPGASRWAVATVRSLLEGAITATSVFFLSWLVVLGPVYASSGASSFAAVLGLAYPVSDVVVVSVVVVRLAARGAGRTLSLALVGAGLVLISVSDSAFALLTATGDYGTGNALDGGWFAGFLVLGLAAHVGSSTPTGSTEERVRRAPGLIWLLLPYLPLALVGALVVLRTAEGRVLSLFEQSLLTVLGGLVLLRQLTALLETHRTSQDLQGEVELGREELHRHAYYDALTGLGNRTLLQSRLEEVVHGPHVRAVTVLVLDLDGFKAVNDSLGHAAGDRLLVVLAERFQACLRGPDTATRLGGDEFAFVLVDLAAEEALVVAERLVAVAAAPVAVDSQEVFLSASVGLVHQQLPADGDELLRNADVAMYVAKESGKNCVRVFEESMHGRLVARLEMEAGLRTAVESGEMRVHYQPTIALETGVCVGVEALVRWERPTHGMVHPADFVPLAEATGQIVPIGTWVLETACAQVRAWQLRPGLEELHVNVNLSPRQLADPDVVDVVRRALEVSGLSARSLVLEITEGVLVEDPEAAARTLDQIKALGVRIALDDFGTGYSALGYLRRFPIDVLKIDRSFVSSLHQGRHDPALVRAVVGLGGALGLEVVAEGIERSEHADILRGLHCQTGQGYFFGKPMPATAMAEWLHQRAALTALPEQRRSAEEDVPAQP